MPTSHSEPPLNTGTTLAILRLFRNWPSKTDLLTIVAKMGDVGFEIYFKTLTGRLLIYGLDCGYNHY